MWNKNERDGKIDQAKGKVNDETVGDAKTAVGGAQKKVGAAIASVGQAVKR